MIIRHTLMTGTAIITLSLMTGCGDRATTDEPSTAETVIEGVTGKTSIDAGRRASDTLKRVSELEQGQIDEVLDSQ